MVPSPPPLPRVARLFARLVLVSGALVLAVLALTACPTGPTGTSRGLAWPDDGDFDDHTAERIATPADFEAFAIRNEAGIAAMKFIIVGFAERHGEHIRFLDGNFYRYHDEWFWFRLANGHPIPGARQRPLQGQAFATPAEVLEWVRTRRAPPPLGMRIIDERLYSDYFYELAVHRENRVLGVGTIVHLPARSHPEPREAIWAFELEFSDAIEQSELEHFFASLQAALPPEIGPKLRFIARSHQQERLVERMRDRDHALASRLLTYAELSVAGEVEVYNPGLIAGRLRKVPKDPSAAAAVLADADEDAIWIMASVPDELPTAAGLLTAVPQTPLAHVNLLARNRGIPNAYLGGLFDDPQLDQLARVHAPVVVLAKSDGTLVLEPISEQEYSSWRRLKRTRLPVLTQVVASDQPYTIDLDTVPPEAVPDLRPVIGGKSAGFPFLLANRHAGVDPPERPLAITIRAYWEHIADFREAIAAAISSPTFDRDGRERFLLLEGQKAFEDKFTSAPDLRWLGRYLEQHPYASDRDRRRDPVAEILARGGIKHAIRDKPLDPATLTTLEAELRGHFGHFGVTQGLRFRSSSTVEDVEGFSGAGLYDSNTGYFEPERQARDKDKKRTVEWALKKTWASYWSWEAFEERRTTGIRHLDGNMAVLVHARFDDPLERSNGVITATLDTRDTHPAGEQFDGAIDRLTMEIDVQLGDLSVTNPPPERAGEVFPEVILIRMDTEGAITIERAAASSEIPSGDADGFVLDDEQVRALTRSVLAVAERWLAVENANLGTARARTSVTLDLEFREMEPSWPAYADPGGNPSQARVILKQARSLDPGIPAGADALVDQPIPRDILSRATAVQRRSCRSARARLDVLEVHTDPMATPNFGHDGAPFLARLAVSVQGLPSGPVRHDLDYRSLADVGHPGMTRGAPWSLDVTLADERIPADSVQTIHVTAGQLRLSSGSQVLLEEPIACTDEVLLASPQRFLLSLLPPRAHADGLR